MKYITINENLTDGKQFYDACFIRAILNGRKFLLKCNVGDWLISRDNMLAVVSNSMYKYEGRKDIVFFTQVSCIQGGV